MISMQSIAMEIHCFMFYVQSCIIVLVEISICTIASSHNHPIESTTLTMNKEGKTALDVTKTGWQNQHFVSS
jgi:hypothetical protein